MIGVGEFHDADAALVPALHHDVAPGDGDEPAVVRHAIFLGALGRGDLVGGVLGVLVVLADGQDRIAAHLHHGRGLAHRAGAAAPFIGEDDALAIVAEHRRVPEREVGVRDGVEPPGLERIRDIHQQPVAGAGAGQQVHGRVCRDVMAVAGTGGRGSLPVRICPRALFHAGFPRARQRGRAQSGEDPRARHHLGRLRIRERHLDHVEPIERVGRIGRVGAIVAAGELAVGPRALVARDVDVDHILVLRIRDDRVGMRSLAGLHVLDETRRGRIGNIVDADTGHVVLGILDAALGTVVPVAPALSRDEEQVSVDGRITLRGDALHHRHRLRGLGIAHVPHRESGEVALVDVVAAEGEVGIDERKPARRVERRRLGRKRHQVHVLAGHARIQPAGLEPTARVGGAGVRLRCQERRRGDQGCQNGEELTGDVHCGKLRVVRVVGRRTSVVWAVVGHQSSVVGGS